MLYCLNNSTVCLITLSTLVFIFCHQSSVLLSLSSVIKAQYSCLYLLSSKLSTLVCIFCHQSSVLLSVSSVIKANAKEEQPKHCVYGKPTFKQCPQSNEELVQGLVHAGNKRHVVTPIQSTCFLILHGCDNRSFRL